MKNIDILVSVYGDKYMEYFLKSVDSMVYNQSYYSSSYNMTFWVPMNYLTTTQKDKIMDIASCYPAHDPVVTVCVNIKYIPVKWFQGLFDTQIPVVKQVQLSRILQLNIFLPYSVKTVVVKDVDQTMQYGSLDDILDTDMLFEIRDKDDRNLYYTRKAVMAYAPICAEVSYPFKDLF